MALKGLKDLAKAVNKTKGDDSLESLASEMAYLVQAQIEITGNKETADRAEYEKSIPYAIHPSNIPACMRSVFYNFLKYDPEPETEDHALISIQNHGTDRHERIQRYLYKMNQLEMLNPRTEASRVRAKTATYIVKNPKHEGKVFGKDYFEIRCYNPVIGIWFSTDGIFRFKNIKGIFEFKTEIDAKWNKRFAPEPNHIEQATCYATAFGLDYIWFLYEDRSLFRRKTYLVKVDPDKRQALLERIATVIDYADRNELPPKEEDRCKKSYCRHPQKCKQELCSQEVWELYNKWKESDPIAEGICEP